MVRVCVKMDEELHKAVKIKAISAGITLEEYVREVVRKAVRDEGESP